MASKPSIFLEIRVFLKTAMAQRVKKHVPPPLILGAKPPKQSWALVIFSLSPLIRDLTTPLPDNAVTRKI